MATQAGSIDRATEQRKKAKGSFLEVLLHREPTETSEGYPRFFICFLYVFRILSQLSFGFEGKFTNKSSEYDFQVSSSLNTE